MSFQEPGPASSRPGGPKVLGILSIIFASLAIFSSLVSGCSLAFSRGGPQAATVAMAVGPGGNPGMAAAYARYYESIYLASALQTVLFLVLSVLLLFVGIGQLRYRSWARPWSVIWGGAAVVALGVMQLLAVLVFAPAGRRLMEELTRTLSAGSLEAKMMGWASSLFGGTGGGLMLLFYLPYPLLLLFYFSRGSMREVMSES